METNPLKLIIERRKADLTFIVENSISRSYHYNQIE